MDDPAAGGWAAQSNPALVCNAADFVFHLDRLRRRSAIGSPRARAGLDELARATGIPRSTLHTYLSGIALPPAERLDVLVRTLGCTPAEGREWAQARERVADLNLLERKQPGNGSDVARLPSANARVRAQRAVALQHLHGLEIEPFPAPERVGAGSGAPVVVPAVVCATWVGTYVYAHRNPASVRSSYLFAGNSWFICQATGQANPELVPGVRSTAWLYTQGDVDHDHQGGWGWLPATALAGFQGGSVVPGVPILKTPSTRR